MVAPRAAFSHFLMLLFAAGLLTAGATPRMATAEPRSFDTWLAAFRTEALAEGIRPEVLNAAFADVAPIPRVIELDRHQPEGRLTFAQYIERVIPKSRIDTAVSRRATHRVLLDEIGARYNVQPRFIVALWGIESDFGRNMGGYSIIASLATLAHDGRRSKFFRGELLDALKILNDGDSNVSTMTGSWAGAMGQSQFMPSSFHAYAVDYDGDGRRDIWTNSADIFASIANYLSRVGWLDDQTWGRAVALPANFNDALIGLDETRSIGGWQVLGVRLPGGGDLPARQLPASIVQPDGAGTAAFMVYKNFRTTLRWNRSTYFALAVGRLADGIWQR